MLVLVSLVVLGTLIVSGAIFATFIGDISKKQISKRALDIGNSLALMPVVKETLNRGYDPEGRIQNLAETVRQKTAAQFVVVADVESIRFSHPDTAKIGKRFVGGDESRALSKGEAYVSEATGTLGPSLRSIVPVFDPDGGVIGFGSVGYLQTRVMETVQGYQREPATLIFMLFVVVLLGATGIARYVKKQTLGLEPREIASLYLDRQAILESIRNGIVAVGETGEIRLINQAARQLLDLGSDTRLIGKSIDEVFAGRDFLDLLKTEVRIPPGEVHADGETFIFSSVPIEYSGAVHGVVASFRRMEDFHRLQQELRQTKAFSEMLRGQAHEYSNKLHTLAGLLQMEAYPEAIDLVTKESTGLQQFIQTLAEAIPHPALAAIIMGKYNRALEMKVDFRFNPDSSMGNLPEGYDYDRLITIIGNLIDNALEAAPEGTGHSPSIQIFMTDIGHDLIFEIEDSGPGIPPADQDKIFEKHYSTKNADNGPRGIHGVGLYLVDTYVNDLGGHLMVSTGDLGGALFTLSLPKHPPSGETP
ncbi:MAG: sensor histidine kinase [Desulfobacterales bacterium]|nr:sensor histidine kinase [Desulfobacterales bacterium]